MEYNNNNNLLQNQIILQPTATNSFSVFLKLPFQTRLIGIIKDNTFICKRKEEHIFKKTNSFGINLELLKNWNIPFKWIKIYTDSGRQFITTREHFLSNGKIFQFKNLGFEPQIFLSLDQFGLDKTNIQEQIWN
jgi:hypothetical protein